MQPDSGVGMGATTWLGMIHFDLATVILLICSVMCVATIIERSIRYFQAEIDVPTFMDRIRLLVKSQQFEDALQFASGTAGPVAAVVKAGLIARDHSKEEIRDAMERVRVRQAAAIDARLPILGTVGATAPFIGLFGTVIGIMRAFHDISLAGQAGTRVVASGIAEALIATAGGLLVAIVAVIAYNFFVNWSSRFTVEMDTAGNEMVHLLSPDQQ